MKLTYPAASPTSLISWVSRAIFAGLIAGAVAITINILLLNLFDALGIETARGGLQKLVKQWMSEPLVRAGVSHAWGSIGLPGPETPLFRTGFKVTVGLIMAAAYTVLLEPWLPGGWLRKGLVAAILFWLINAAVVLPLLGEGFAGARLLSPLGMVSYAVAHTTFFVAVAGLYAWLTGGRTTLAVGLAPRRE